jgi:predicted nucleotidyltransferase
MDPATVLAALRDHEAEFRAAGIVRLSLFGSTARHEARIDFDIDLLAAFDLIEEGTLKPRVRRRVEPEIVRAF